MANYNLDKEMQDYIRNQRERLLRSSKRHHTFLKGDKRVYYPRLCNVCAKPLTNYIRNTGEYVVSHPHIYIHIGGAFDMKAGICKTITSCYAHMEKRVENNEVEEWEIKGFH